MIKSRIITLIVLFLTVLLTAIRLFQGREERGIIPVVIYCICLVMVLLIETGEGRFRRTWSELVLLYLPYWGFLYCSTTCLSEAVIGYKNLGFTSDIRRIGIVLGVVVISGIIFYVNRIGYAKRISELSWIIAKYTTIVFACVMLFEQDKLWNPWIYLCFGLFFSVLEVSDMLSMRRGKYAFLLLELLFGVFGGLFCIGPTFKTALFRIFQLGDDSASIGIISLVVLFSALLMILEDTGEAMLPGELDLAWQMPVRYIYAIGCVIGSVYSLMRLVARVDGLNTGSWYHPFVLYFFIPAAIVFIRYLGNEREETANKGIILSICFGITFVSCFAWGRIMKTDFGIVPFLSILCLVLFMRAIVIKTSKKTPRRLVNHCSLGIIAILITWYSGTSEMWGKDSHVQFDFITLVIVTLLCILWSVVQIYLDRSYAEKEAIYERFEKGLSLGEHNAFLKSLSNTRQLISVSTVAACIVLVNALVHIFLWTV